MSHYAVAVFSNTPYGFDQLLDPYDEEAHFQRFVADPEEVQKKYAEFLIRNPSWEELGFDYYLQEFGYKREGNEIVQYYNPNAKWDWYTLDGKDYMFNLKKGAAADESGCYRKKDYKYPKNSMAPYAFITPDGEWHAPGTVGWFAMDDSTEETMAAYNKQWRKYVDNDDNPYVSFVDCHI